MPQILFFSFNHRNVVYSDKKLKERFLVGISIGKKNQELKEIKQKTSKKSFHNVYKHLTDHFAILEPLNPTIHELYEAQNCQFADFKSSEIVKCSVGLLVAPVCSRCAGLILFAISKPPHKTSIEVFELHKIQSIDEL